MKILIIRLSSIGDIVLTSPVVRCLKLQTNNEIHYLTKQSYETVLSNSPYIDKLLFFNGNLDDTITNLINENYDLIIDLHHNTRSRIIKSKLNKPSSSFNKLDLKKLILTCVKINLLPDIHIVDRYMATVKHLGVVNDGKGLDYFINYKDTLPPEVILPSNYLVFAIGGQHKTKIVPTDIIIKICQSKYHNIPVFLIGGKENVDSANEISSACSNIVNLTGKLSINQSALLIEKSDLVLSGDTGMMHIAAALKKNIISFWGNTVPQFGMYPYFPTNYSGVNTIVENKNLWCRPCSKIGYEKCPLGHFKCMRWLENIYS